MATSFNYTEFSPVVEEIDATELECLDIVTPTSIVDFMRIYAVDKSFTPPTSAMVFDSDFTDINIDDDESKSMNYDFEDAFEDDDSLKRAREI